MASNLRGILGHVQTSLQAINGAGGYTYDVSGTDQVFHGTAFNPERVPAIGFSLVSLQGRPGDLLNSYTRTLTIEVWGWVAAAADTAESRINAATDFLDDIVTALEGDRTRGARVVDTTIKDSVAFNGDELNVPGFGVVVVHVEMWWSPVQGVGV